MLGPRDVDENLESAFSDQIEKPPRRHMIKANDIGPQLGNLLQIARRLFRGSKHFTLRVRGKGTVGNSLYVEFASTEPEESSVHAHSVWALA